MILESPLRVGGGAATVRHRLSHLKSLDKSCRDWCNFKNLASSLSFDTQQTKQYRFDEQERLYKNCENQSPVMFKIFFSSWGYIDHTCTSKLR